jgi:hypothetical protein
MQSVACAEESTEMVMLTFGIMGLIALIRLIRTEKGNTLRAFRQTKQSLWPLALCLLSAGLAINGLVYILPSVNTVVFYTIENGGVLLMAYTYGVPVVASDVPTFVEETDNGRAGILFAAESPEALKNALLKAMDVTPEQREEYRKAIRALACERHNWKTIAHSTAEVYREIM